MEVKLRIQNALGGSVEPTVVMNRPHAPAADIADCTSPILDPRLPFVSLLPDLPSSSSSTTLSSSLQSWDLVLHLPGSRSQLRWGRSFVGSFTVPLGALCKV